MTHQSIDRQLKAANATIAAQAKELVRLQTQAKVNDEYVVKQANRVLASVGCPARVTIESLNRKAEDRYNPKTDGDEPKGFARVIAAFRRQH